MPADKEKQQNKAEEAKQNKQRVKWSEGKLVHVQRVPAQQFIILNYYGNLY